MMLPTTIAAMDGEITWTIHNYHTYGAEVIINALVKACKGHAYLQREHIEKLLDEAYKREEAEDHAE